MAIPGQDPPPQNPKYCIGVVVVTTRPGDQGQVGTFFTDIGALLAGRDPEPTDNTVFNRYVLSGYTAPGGGEYDTLVLIGFNANVAPGIRSRIMDGRFRINPLQQELEDLANLTDPQVEARVRQRAGELGQEKIWVVRLGDGLTGDLPSKFGAI